MKDQIYNTLSSLVRDNYITLCGIITQLICESFDHLKIQVIDEIVWVVDQLIIKARTPSIRDVVVIMVRQLSVNVRDQRSMIICRSIVEILHNHVNQQEIGWLFAVDHLQNGAIGSDNHFSSLIFVKFLRLIEEHFQSPELIQLR